jgi:membrane protease YdiL (CAAX protease family)
MTPFDRVSEPEPASEFVPARRTRTRLSLTRAAITLIVGFIGAQLLGKFVADYAAAHGATAAHGGQTSRAGMDIATVVPSMLASELALLAVALCAPVLSGLPTRRTLGLRGAPAPAYGAAALGTVMLGPLGDELMSLFSRAFPNFTLGVVPALHDLAKHLPVFWLWPTFALLPGLAEELLFRGVLQRAFVRPVVAIVVSGCTFALFHIDPVHVVGVLPLGLFLAWVAQRSSTSVTIVAHVINNSVALLAIQTNQFDVGFGTDHELPASALLGSCAAFAVAASVVWRCTRPTPTVASEPA